MADWWEHANPGAPMVGPAFIRPLYPPDAAAKGKRPSSDGADVVAIKRAVSRSGHWPWQAFDDAYSNAFAHGKSGNVYDNGLAGLQRQNGLDATGWMGEPTYNLIRSALVPDGLPHAGEHILDATAIDLLEEYARSSSGPGPIAYLERDAIPSPNYSSRGGSSVRLIVLHTAEGARTYHELGSFFASSSSGVSSHVGIDDTDGVIGLYVERSWKAWTASGANPVAVQAELCAFASWTAAEWDRHPHMLDNTARWIAEEASAFGLPITALMPSEAQGSGRGVCEHTDLGAWGGGHWDCGDGFPLGDVLARARELNGG
jgi:hypothetical protein